MTMRHAFRRRRAQLVDAADGVDGFFDLVSDFRLDLLRRGARLHRGDDDGGEVDFRKAIDAEQRERKHADHRERQNEHRREDRTANRERSEPLHD